MQWTFDRYKFLRYEDLSLAPEKTLSDLWKFLDFDMTGRMTKIIKQKTNVDNSGNTFSTYRKTKQHTFHWREELDFNTMHEVQKACLPVLKVLGLRVFRSEEEYKNMDLPVLLPE